VRPSGGCGRTSALSIDRLLALGEGSKLSGPHGVSGTRMTAGTDSVFSTLRVIALRLRDDLASPPRIDFNSATVEVREASATSQLRARIQSTTHA